MLQDNHHALARYNHLFDNQQYQAIANQLTIDLQVKRESLRVSDIMNLISDVALNLNGHSDYVDTWIKLATICGQNRISIATIDMIYDYLLVYQQSSDTQVEDFQLTAKGLLKAYESKEALQSAISCANGVHGWRGRMAYDLLTVSDYLVQVAIQLLINGNPSYIQEKLHLAIQRLLGALHEGLQHSKRPKLFDFSNKQFPDTKTIKRYD